jgi:PAS domain S-box-containing protein
MSDSVQQQLPRMDAEQALRDSEARLRAIFQTVVDGIVTIDQNGIIYSVNPAIQRLFSYREDEMLGRNVSMLMPSPFAEEHDRYLQNYLHTGVKKIIGIGREVLGRRKDGSTFPIDLAVSEHLERGRRMFTGLIRDVSERKRAEAERERLLHSERAARAEAERASKAKDDFLAALSHELRTPLTPVMLTLSLLEKAPDMPARFRPDLEVIRRGVQTEARLIDDLLDLTRVVSGKLVLRFQTADVHELILAASRTCVQTDGIQADFELTAAEHYVRADPARLQQVFWNLLSNAHKFTPIGGQILVRTGNPRPGLVRIEVRDSGRGIDPDLLHRIFNAFEQGDAAVARQFGGLGLGLAIARAIVDAHGGQIAAHSAGKGHGATFTVELATAPAPLSARSTATDSDAPHSGSTPPTPAAQPLRILLVEDHESTCKVVALALRHSGYEVHTARGAREAIDLVGRIRFDLMISDLGLPDGSGYDVMEHVARHYGLKGIALSGYGMSDDIRRSIEAGFSQHLTKPVDLQSLIAAVDQVAAG